MKFIVNIHEISGDDPSNKKNGHPYLYAVIEKHEEGKEPMHCALESQPLSSSQQMLSAEHYRINAIRNFFWIMTDTFGTSMFPEQFKPISKVIVQGA